MHFEQGTGQQTAPSRGWDEPWPLEERQPRGITLQSQLPLCHTSQYSEGRWIWERGSLARGHPVTDVWGFDAALPPLWLSMRRESRRTNIIQTGLEIRGWIQNYFPWKEERKASLTTHVQNAVIISQLFNAKPPNHTFWNSHSINNCRHSLRRAENSTCLSHSPPECSDHSVEFFSPFGNTAIKWNHFQLRDRARLAAGCLWPSLGMWESWKS